MSRRTATWLAWSLWAVCVALIALSLLLDFVTDDAPLPHARPSLGFTLPTGVLSLAFPTVGALVASRLPTNPIGWIFCGVGLLYAVQRFAVVYADYALVENFALPGGEYVAWFSSWVVPANLALGVLLMLLFPDGRLLSRRWRIVAWAALCGAALSALGIAFMPGQLMLNHDYVENPFGVVGVIGGGFTTYEFFTVSIVLGETLLLTGNLAALFSLILRLRRARGDERQHLKWFLYAAVLATVCLSLTISHLIVYYFTTTFLFHTANWLPSWPVVNAVTYVGVFALPIIPAFTYIAILRHRLYDIDVVINRTLVYGALTACIVGSMCSQ